MAEGELGRGYAVIERAERQRIVNVYSDVDQESTNAGQVLAEQASLFGLFRNEVRSPCAGMVETISKITGQIITFEIAVDETKRFGALNVRPRVCNSRPVTEEPKTTAFVEVEQRPTSSCRSSLHSCGHTEQSASI